MRGYLTAIFVCYLLSTASHASSRSPHSKNTAPLPRSKQNKSKKQSFNYNFLGRAFREIKGHFGSELESLVLSLTRPIDSVLPPSQIQDITNIVKTEYENPIFLVGLLAKISRKFIESNIYTKLKSILIIHHLIDNTDAGAREAIKKCINDMRVENDPKIGSQTFFCVDDLDEIEQAASNVAELKTAEMSKLYVDYVFDYVSLRGDKSSILSCVEDKSELLLTLIEQGKSLEEICKSKVISAPLIGGECVNLLKEDRNWILKQLLKIYENSSREEGIEEENALLVDIRKVLSEYGVKLKALQAKQVEVEVVSESPVKEGSRLKGAKAKRNAESDQEVVGEVLREPVIESAVKATASVRTKPREEASNSVSNDIKRKSKASSSSLGASNKDSKAKSKSISSSSPKKQRK